MEDLTTLYCEVGEFWKSFREEWTRHLIGSGKPTPGPEPKLSISEMMTIVILFHQSSYITFRFGFNPLIFSDLALHPRRFSPRS